MICLQQTGTMLFLVVIACFSLFRPFCRAFAFCPFELVEFLWCDVSFTWRIESDCADPCLFKGFVNHVELVWWCAVLGEWQVFSSWSLTIFTCIRCFSWWKSCIFIPILSYSCYCYFAGCARGDAKSPGFDFSWDVDNNSSFWSGSIICWLPSKAVVRNI